MQEKLQGRNKEAKGLELLTYEFAKPLLELKDTKRGKLKDSTEIWPNDFTELIVIPIEA